MVQILPRFDPGGEIGQSLGSGLGSGLEAVTNRNLLKSGISEAKDKLSKAKENNETINPLDFTLSLMETFSRAPGGLQALSDLSGPIMKEVNRQNLMVPNPQEDGTELRKNLPIPNRSPNDDIEITDPEKVFNEMYLQNLKRTQDPETAAQLTQSQIAARTATQQNRQNEQRASESFLNNKLQSTFTEPLSAPIENKFSEEYFNLTKTMNPNKAFNKLMPKYRSAQVDEFNLKNSNAQTRPSLFLGDLKSRMDNARGSLQKITDIDPEYSMQLAQDNLFYGPSEAAEIVRPGDNNYKQFVKQIPTGPDSNNIAYARGSLGLFDNEAFGKDQKKYVDNIRPKLKEFLQKKFNPQTDSLLALRANMFDKNFPEEQFLDVIQEVFPDGAKTDSFSDFNKNEYPKLFEPISPGLMDILNSVIDLDFGRVGKALKKRYLLGSKKK